jgi:predicted DNA-binding transcriptional regulator AlpA
MPVPTSATTTHEILTPEEVAALLRVAPSWVYEKSRRRCKDPLPVRRIGKYIRFKKTDIDLWLASTAPAPKKNVRNTNIRNKKGRK